MTIKYIIKCNICGHEDKGTCPRLENVKDIQKPHSDCGGTYVYLSHEEYIKNVPARKSKDKSKVINDESGSRKIISDIEESDIEEPDIETDESNEEFEYICKYCDKNAQSEGKYDPKKNKIGHNIGKYRGFEPCSKSKEDVILCYSRVIHQSVNNDNELPTNLNVFNDVGGIVIQKQLIKISDIRRLFVARTDRYSLYNNRDAGKSIVKVRDIKKELTDGIIGLHLLGSRTIGVRPWNPIDYTGLWICYDIDKKDKDGNIIVNNPEETVNAIIDLLKEWYGLNGYAEMSGTEGNYHIWIFLKPTNYTKIMEFDQAFNERCKREEKYNYVNKAIQKRVEKPDGRMIKLPLGINIKNGVRCMFVNGVDLSKIEQQELPAPWGNPTSSSVNNKVVESNAEIHEIPFESIQEKEYRVNKLLTDLFKPDADGNITVPSLKCDNPECDKTMDDFSNKKEKIIETLLHKHGCGGNVKLKLYQARLNILHSHEFVEMEMQNRYNQPDDNKRNGLFIYEILGNELLIKFTTYKGAYSDAMYLSGQSRRPYHKLKGMLSYSKVDEIFV